MNIRESIQELYPDFEFLFMDGYDDCIVGVCRRYGFEEPVIAYDEEKVLLKLMFSGLSEEEAQEFFEFNQIGAWVGEKTPVFIQLLT